MSYTLNGHGQIPFEVEQSKRYHRVVTLRRPPFWLLSALLTVMPFDWWLENYSWDATEKKRYKVHLTFQRRTPFVLISAGGVKEKFRIYNRTGPIAMVRLLWLVLWSKPEIKEQDDGKRVCETGGSDADTIHGESGTL